MKKWNNWYYHWTYFHNCCYFFQIEFYPLWLPQKNFILTTSWRYYCFINEIVSFFIVICVCFSFLSNSRKLLIKLQQHQARFLQSFQRRWFFIHSESSLPKIHLSIMHIPLMLKLMTFLDRLLWHICCNVHIWLDIVNIHFKRQKSLIHICMNHFKEQNQSLPLHYMSCMCCCYHMTDIQ